MIDVIEFMLTEFGVRGRPNYPWLRSIAGDFEYGTNFASAGGSSRNSTGWKPDHGFNTPFSLNVQVRWFERYTVRLLTYYYYKNSFGDSAGKFLMCHATQQKSKKVKKKNRIYDMNLNVT